LIAAKRRICPTSHESSYFGGRKPEDAASTGHKPAQQSTTYSRRRAAVSGRFTTSRSSGLSSREPARSRQRAAGIPADTLRAVSNLPLGCT